MDVIYTDNNYVENLNKGIIKTFFRMFLGLLATGLVAFYTYKTGYYLEIPYAVIGIIEIAVVLLFSFLFRKLSPTMVTALYFIYAFVNRNNYGGNICYI